MTISQWQEKHWAAHDRAERIARSIRERARLVAILHLKCGPDMAFMAAHNWYQLPWMTPAQNQACRLIKHLERKSWEPHRIASQYSDKLWSRVAR